MAYDNLNKGALFRNDRKTTPSHPEARGQCEVECPHCKKTATFWLSAWTKAIKQGKREGEKMQSLAFTAMDDQPSDRHNAEKSKSKGQTHDDHDTEDDIPF